MPSTQRPAWFATVRALLPRGGALPEGVWLARHRGICLLLWLHLVVISGISLLESETVLGTLGGLLFIAACAAGAMYDGFGKEVRASLATLGLLTCSANLIGYFGGMIEAHFHFFVIIAVVSLYQSWRPYLIAVGYLLVHHLVLGTLLPSWVYNHELAIEHPWWFALVHAGALLAESVACLVFWRVTEDATDAERANGEALRLANEELWQTNRAVADLVAMLSHDLRSPLGVLMGYSEMALESWPEMSEEERFEFVRKASAAGSTLHQLLDDTLTVSAIEAEGMEPRPVPVRVDEAVRDAVAALPEPRPTADLSGLEAVTADVDRGQLAQVLTNLVTNATKYGGGHFAVSAHQDEHEVHLRVADSGPGVPEEFVASLFERFTRSEEARRGPQKGTGLGLYIARSLLLANDGTIDYEPTPGGGATFYLRLPRGQVSVPMSSLPVPGSGPPGDRLDVGPSLV